MGHFDVIRLALVLAEQAEIESMKAKNFAQDKLDNTQFYTEEQFYSKACTLENLANCPDEHL